MKLHLPDSVLLTFLLVAGAGLSVQAQAGRTVTTYHANADTGKTGDIREKLVQLALQNPNYEIADRKVGVADYNLRKAKGGWLNVLSASGNLNELSIKKNQGVTPGSANALFFPRYNFNLAIPFDYFTTRTNEVRIARENVYIAEAEKNESYRQIRKDVLAKYEDYLMHKEMLELQTRVTQGEYTEFKTAEKDFADGSIIADVFKKAETAYYNQQMKKVEMQRNFNVAKYEMEQLIGVNIDDVLNKK